MNIERTLAEAEPTLIHQTAQADAAWAWIVVLTLLMAIFVGSYRDALDGKGTFHPHVHFVLRVGWYFAVVAIFINVCLMLVTSYRAIL